MIAKTKNKKHVSRNNSRKDKTIPPKERKEKMQARVKEIKKKMDKLKGK